MTVPYSICSRLELTLLLREGGITGSASVTFSTQSNMYGFALCPWPPACVELLALSVPPCGVSGGHGAFFTLVRRREEVEKSLKKPTSAPSPSQVKSPAEILPFLPRPEGCATELFGSLARVAAFMPTA